MTLEPPSDPVAPENIVPIDENAAKELEMLRAKVEKHACCGRHRKVTVDPFTRTLSCRDCGFVVDPFDYIDQWAREGERRMESLKCLDTKISIARMELHKLTKQLESVRGKLKRDGFPQPHVELREFKRAMWNAHNA